MEILNVKEVAEFLNCSPSTIRKLVRERRIPFFRIASKINFNKSKIEEWIREKEEKGDAE